MSAATMKDNIMRHPENSVGWTMCSQTFDTYTSEPPG